MRSPLAFLGALLMAAPAAAIDPAKLAFNKLPSQPEMPDALTTFDGKKIATKEAWFAERRPELKELFQELMYGRYPAVKPKVSAKVVHEDLQALGGKATLREVALTVADGAPPVYWLIVTPHARGPVPMFVGLNFAGNHAVTTDPKVRIPDGWMAPNRAGVKNNKATEAGRGSQADVWPLETITERGYGLAVAFYGDVIPDNPKIRGGLADLLMPQREGGLAPNETAAIMSWAWGIHRGIDYLTALPEIDAKRIAVVGHSRLGKTALVAAAFDDRVALAIPSQAGCGGTAPDRRKNPKSEPIERINTNFPHWFCSAFKQFNTDATKLPFDQHALVAICAPRPVLFTCATDDQWADPPGQFEVLKAATPVYKLLGVEGLAERAAPTEGKLNDSRLGYWIRPGKHEMGRADWGTYLAYADKWLK